MITHINRIIDRVLNRLQRQPDEAETAKLLAILEEGHHALDCRVCGGRGRVQLIGETGKYEYLCYNDLGPFLELFTDPRSAEFTIVRLP